MYLEFVRLDTSHGLGLNEAFSKTSQARFLLLFKEVGYKGPSWIFVTL